MSLVKKLILILVIIYDYFDFITCSAIRPPMITIQASKKSLNNSSFVQPNFVSPRDWGAITALKNSPRLKNPVPFVDFYQTNTEECFNRTHCSEIVTRIHNMRVTLMNEDIQYNFLIGGDGLVYVARNWDVVSGVSNGYKGRSIGIGLIGTYFTNVVPSALIRNAINLIEFGIRNGKINEDAHYISIPPMFFVIDFVDEVMYKFMRRFDHSHS